MNYQDIKVTVKPKSSKDTVSEKGDRYIVETVEKAEGGKANEAVKKLVAEYFDVEEKKVMIIKGTISPAKTVRIYS